MCVPFTLVAAQLGGLLLAALLFAPPAVAGDWPQFRGPRRDGVSRETGLLQTWPEGGPKLVWSVSGVGRGYSSAIIMKGALYVTGDVGGDLVIFAFETGGGFKWSTTNGRSWKGPWPGSRASCTYEGGRLYHINAHGRAVCLDPADGKELWAVGVLERFGSRNIKWGISECPLLDRDRVIVTPGGGRCLMAALDRNTGETVWTGEPLRFQRTRRLGGGRLRPPAPDVDRAGYASPILFELGGRRLIAGCSARHLFCVDAETGKLLWTHPVPARWEVIGAIPIFRRGPSRRRSSYGRAGGTLFFTAPDEFGGKLFRVLASRNSVRLEGLWETPVDSCHGAFVLAEGRLYGSGHSRFKGWGCIDAVSGKMIWTRRDLVKGSGVYADGRLYVLSEDGTMSLLKPTPTAFETVGQFRITEQRQRDVWAHPAVCDGRLYLRYHDTLFCYDIKGKAGSTRAR